MRKLKKGHLLQNKPFPPIELDNSSRDPAVPLAASDPPVLGRVKTSWPEGHLSCNYS